ncbi:MAG: (2Fe-2S)-binding protein [Rhodospirillales bacterium]|nr:(2Fe-2S)-binding protein [Rhodospirillales bacterium]
MINLSIAIERRSQYHAGGNDLGRKLMFVCVCNALTEQDVEDAIIKGGVRTPGGIYHHFGTEPQCGLCEATLRTMINAATRQAAEERAPRHDGGERKSTRAAASPRPATARCEA